LRAEGAIAAGQAAFALHPFARLSFRSPGTVKVDGVARAEPSRCPQDADPGGIVSTAPQGTTRWRSIFSSPQACTGGDAGKAAAPKEWPEWPLFRSDQARVRSHLTLPHLREQPSPSSSRVMRRSEILWRCVPCPTSWMRERPPGKASLERHRRRARALSQKSAEDSVLALGRLISFGFRKKAPAGEFS
jgi:hypothetical protein